mgnify:CR=1 FL=1
MGRAQILKQPILSQNPKITHLGENGSSTENQLIFDELTVKWSKRTWGRDGHTERLMAMIWCQKFVRLKLQVVIRFSRHMWVSQKFALKLRDVQKKSHDVHRKLCVVENGQNRPGRLQVPRVPCIRCLSDCVSGVQTSSIKFKRCALVDGGWNSLPLVFHFLPLVLVLIQLNPPFSGTGENRNRSWRWIKKILLIPFNYFARRDWSNVRSTT